MTCFFIGHRNAETTLMPQLETAVLQHITSYDVTNFIVGQYGAFDRMAARAVVDAKKLFPGVTLSILLPYHPSERSISVSTEYNDTFYPPGMEHVPRKFAIIHANRYAVKYCDYLIAYAWQPPSNAKQLVEFARR